MQLSGGGRPRLVDRRRPGATPQEEVLDAAAELFTTVGVAATSTRRIAEAVGVRQASLYHHFRTKDAILAALLGSTVEPSLHRARLLRAGDEPAEVRLHALARFDAGELWDGRWNLGVLYQLPELRSGEFDRFHRHRDELRAIYRELAEDVLTGIGAPPQLDLDPDLVFRLVESVVNLRTDGLGGPGQPDRTADHALWALGWRGDLAALRRRSAALLAGD